MKRAIKSMIERLGYRIDGIRYVPRPLLDPRNLRVVEFDDVVCRRIA